MRYANPSGVMTSLDEGEFGRYNTYILWYLRLSDVESLKPRSHHPLPLKTSREENRSKKNSWFQAPKCP
jgi:hypothetical protein